MSLTIDDLFATATPEDFQAAIRLVMTSIGLTPLVWPATGALNAFIAGFSSVLGVPSGTAVLDLALAGIDGLVASIARSGFLDPASTVTIDGTIGWLDFLAVGLGVTRELATYATGPVTLTNSGASTRGPFAIGTFHLANTVLGKTYANKSAFSLPPGDITTTFGADVAGSSSTTVANVLTPVTSFVGVSVKTAGGANTNTLTGIDSESNDDLVIACRGHLRALNPKLGPKGSFEYFAKATKLVGYPTLTSPINRVKSYLDPDTGFMHLYLANTSGASSAPDCALMQTFLDVISTPGTMTLIVAPAAMHNVAAVYTVLVPAAFAAIAATQTAVAFTAYLQSLPLGGTPGNVQGLQLSEVQAAIWKACPYVENFLAMTLNGVSDVVLASNECAVSSPPPVVTVVTS